MELMMDVKKRLDGFTLEHKFQSTTRRLGILGASGSGKSMTLKMLAGIETPEEGMITFNDHVLFHSKEKINVAPGKRKIGYLFQNYALFPNMTVGENIAISFTGSKKEKQHQLQYYLERFSLVELKNRYPHELSGGQQQRTALARIMAYEPDVILLDEPFSAMDERLKNSLKKEMERYLSDFKGMLVLVSHNRDEIYQFSDELLVLSDGKRIAFGKTKELYRNPIRKETASLMGCENLSRIHRLNENQIEAIDWGIILDKTLEEDHEESYVGIYGEHITLESSGQTKEDTICIQPVATEVSEKVFTVLVSTILKENHEPVVFEMSKDRFKELEGDYVVTFQKKHMLYLS